MDLNLDSLCRISSVRLYYRNMLGKAVYKLLNTFGIIRRYDSLKKKTVKSTYDTVDAFLKLGLSILFVVVLIWISVLLYVLFYYAYVPAIEHIKPANLQFTSCEVGEKGESKAVCGFPSAHVQLTKYNSLLMIGQPYKITIVMDMPESENNKQLGMFMVCGLLLGKGGAAVAHSCRSTMLRYRSPLLNVLRLFALGPLFVFDFMEEKQTLSVELFYNFEDDQNFPVTDMFIELKSDRVEIYSARVHVDAHLSGLRYFMFHWPFFSAVLGSVSNLGVIVFVVALSWFKLYGPADLTDEASYETVEDIGGKQCLILKDDDFEDESPQERKFVLERKLSSSEA